MNESVSSVYFNTANPQSFAAEGPAAPFYSIPFAIELTDSAGHVAWLVEPTRSISADYGSEFTEVRLDVRCQAGKREERQHDRAVPGNILRPVQ